MAVTLTEWVAAIGVTLSAVGMLGAVIYRHGLTRGRDDKNDSVVQKLDGAVASDASFKGAQEVRNAEYERVAAEVRRLSGDMRAGSEVQNAHERQDIMRFTNLEVRLDRADARFDRVEQMVRDGFAQLSAQINLVARGEAGRLYEVKSPGDHSR